MTVHTEHADTFHNLHKQKDILVLFNVWDAGSARAVERAGSEAIATGSASVAGAHGYDDGQLLPLETVLANAEEISGAVSIPVTVDFEAGYAEDMHMLQDNVRRLLATGVVGINFEDQHIGGEKLYSVSQQAKKIEAIRRAADGENINLFINARTDVWLDAGRKSLPKDNMLKEALERLSAYTDAGADGYFVPGLSDIENIQAITKASVLPVNIMITPAAPDIHDLESIGVSRISYGPGPWLSAIDYIQAQARIALQ